MKKCFKSMSALICIAGLVLVGFSTTSNEKEQPNVSMKKVLSAKQIELQPLASRFDMKGKRAVVIEVVLSGPDQSVSISSTDFAFQYKANGKELTVPCVGLYQGYGIWDLASQGPVTDEKNFSKESNQQLLFLIPSDVQQGQVLRTVSKESIEVISILSNN